MFRAEGCLPRGKQQVGGTRHMKRRLLRFGFDSLKSGSFKNECQKTKQRECPVGVLYTYLKYRTAIGVSVSYGNYRYRGCVIHIGVGLMRCSFRQTGQCEGLRT